MAQNNRSANELINAAFFLIGEFDENDPIPGDDTNRALDVLNLLIDHWSGEQIYIPFTKEISFNLVPNQRDYVFSNVPHVTPDVVSNRIVQVRYCQLILPSQPNNNVWTVREITRSQLYIHSYNEKSGGQPIYFLFEPEEDRSVVSFYPVPNIVYQVNLLAKFYLNRFDLNTNINNVPLSFHRFLIYALGRELLSYYPTGNWPAQAEDTYQLMYQNMMNSNDIDLSVRPSALLRDPRGFYSGWRTNIASG